ncbi:hypothetical protein PTKIN_Ptkin08bG0130200 [Pterospermum kingtungense]
MAEPNKSIPQDITDEILPRLPVKSLVRFECVCKSWRSLITSPPFTRNHFKRAMSHNPKTIDQKLLIPQCCGFKFIDMEKSFDERAAISIRPPFWQNRLHDSWFMSWLGMLIRRRERFQFRDRLAASILVGRKRKLIGTGESLYCCVLKKGIGTVHVEFWLMGKYCSEGSWTKVLRIPVPDFIYMNLRYLLKNLLCISKDNGFIIGNGEDITRFDVEGGVVQKIRMCNSHSLRWRKSRTWSNHPYGSDAMTYAETLVSPHPIVFLNEMD